MRKLTMMKRITDLRDDFIEEAYLPDAIPVLPVKPRRTIPVLGIPFALAGKIAAASVAGIVLIGVVFGIAIPALRELDTHAPDESDAPYEDTEPASNGEIRVTITPKLARPGETVAILIEPPAADGYRLYFTYATTPVGADLLAYTAEPTGDPSLYTVTIPQTPPSGSTISISNGEIGSRSWRSPFSVTMRRATETTTKTYGSPPCRDQSTPSPTRSAKGT